MKMNRMDMERKRAAGVAAIARSARGISVVLSVPMARIFYDEVYLNGKQAAAAVHTPPDSMLAPLLRCPRRLRWITNPALGVEIGPEKHLCFDIARRKQ